MTIERLRWDGSGAPAYAADLRRVPSIAPDAEAEAQRIVADVRARGDEALRELTARFDATERAPEELGLRVDPGAIEAARGELDPDLLASLEVAARNIESFARAERDGTTAVRASLPQGQTVSVVSNPIAAAGVYVPGGGAVYPSSVLMNCVPARVAGVDRVVVASPPGANGSLSPVVLAACALAGTREVYAIGGAQAIAALAYGTESIPAVDLVAGPGNAYVNAAKKAVLGDVGVDGIAGPSELVVVMDADANAAWIALDLLAQAEHGSGGLLAAISPNADALASLAGELEHRDGPEIVISLVEAPDLNAAVELADALAPEHLELALEVADERLAGDRVAGAVFFGPRGAVAFGDYAAGSNHVLPTGGAARFAGPLGVSTFRRRTSVVDLPADAAAGLAPRVATLARAEGFPLHGESAEARVGD
jgi:histidinol dehydrogenase